MNLRRLLRSASSALHSEKGRSVAGRLTDSAADTARKASPKHASLIEKARERAKTYLHRP